MKNLWILSIVFIFCLSACSKPEKPKLTLGQYAKQVNTAKGVINKIMADPDFKRMHMIALAVESARAVSCITVSDECNLYGKILNRIVFATQTGPLSDEEKILIYKWINEMDGEIKKGEEILTRQWSDYIRSHSEEK